MKYIFRLFILAFLLPVQFEMFAQAQLVEEVSATSKDQLIIPYKKYTLPNGLTVLIHEDHSDPIVHVDVTYHVGSARELVGRSGFAHFFEHMMFQGSEHVRDEEHFKIVTESGGTLNGTTNLDRTNYFETMPSNQLEMALWLEADRMGWFLDSVTTAKFEIQRATVKNERGQNYDNRPYGLVTEKTIEALYPFGHPYSWTTIGYISDLNAATVDDLKRFFLRWYGPNNATLTVAGDVNTDNVLQLVEKYFGNIPRGPEVKLMKPDLPFVNADRYISYEDNIRFPMLRMTFSGVQARHKDEAAMDVLANILGGGNNSILYQEFVKKQIAVQANAMNPANELAGEFAITILPYPDKKLSDIEAQLKRILEDFEKRGVTDDDINRYKAQHEADELRSLQTVSGKASKLAYYQTFTGNPNYISQDMKRYEMVTKEDVMRVYNTYIKGKGAVILSVVPKGKTDLVAKPDNFSRPSVPAGFRNDLSEYEKLTYNKGKYPFAADYRPSAGANPESKLPEFWEQQLKNGLKMISTEYKELPVMVLRMSVKGGKLLDGTSKAGLASLTASIMNEGTTNYTAEQLSLNLELLGSSIDVYATGESMEIEVFSLEKNIDQTLAYLKEVLFSPRFSEEDFKRIQKEQLESIANQKNQAGTIASNVYSKFMYGENSIYGMPTIGTQESVSSLTIDDVKNYYQQNIVASVTNMTIVSGLNKKDILKKLSFLNTWKSGNVQLPSFVQPQGTAQTKIIFVDKPGAAQSEIRVGHSGIQWDATGDYYKAGIMNYVLGGAFNSRLNLNLREKKGYTYGVRSGFNGSKYTGTFTVSGGFLAHVTDSVVIEILNELKNYKDNGITAQELVFTKNSIGQRDALKYESPLQKAGFVGNIIEYGLDKSFVKTQKEILQSMTVFDVNQLSKQLIKTDQLLIVIVGDKMKVFDKLKKLNIPIEEVDYTGKKL
jgi:zinc protease